MKREAAELTIADHHLKIYWMLTARAPGRLMEFDAIHTKVELME